MHENVFNCLVN